MNAAIQRSPEAAVAQLVVLRSNMDALTAIEKIKGKIAEIEALGPKKLLCPEFKKWNR